LFGEIIVKGLTTISFSEDIKIDESVARKMMKIPADEAIDSVCNNLFPLISLILLADHRRFILSFSALSANRSAFICGKLYRRITKP